MSAGYRKPLGCRVLGFAIAALLGMSAAPGTGAFAYQLKILHEFCSRRLCADGSAPASALTMDLSGNLYGFSYSTAFELSPNADKSKWSYKVLYTFCTQQGGGCPDLRGNLIVDVSGNLYGVQFDTGVHGRGEIFELQKQPNKIKYALKDLYDFGSHNGDAANPTSGLTYAGASTGVPYDGVSALYGVTFEGGSLGDGAAYQIVPNGQSWDESILYNFCRSSCAGGYSPFLPLTVDGNGNLFGSTGFGGAHDHGTVFQLSNTGGTWALTVLYDLCALKKCKDGVRAELLLDSAGDILAASQGGAHDSAGLIYELAPNGSQYQNSVLYTFCSVPKNCRDGASPVGSLAMDASGNLFGATVNGGGDDIDYQHAGGGVVYEFSGPTLMPLYAFCAKRNCLDGEYPTGGVVMDSAGNLFGATQFGGTYNEGTVFELTP